MIQKIHELIKEVYPSTNLGDFGLKEQLCVKVSEATVEETCKWLEQNLVHFIQPDNKGILYESKSLFDNLKKALEV